MLAFRRRACLCWFLAVVACSEDAETSSGLDLAALDETTDPCVDFYQYACGGWIASHSLSNDSSVVNRFQEPLNDAVAALSVIVSGDSIGHPQPGDPNSQLIGNFFNSCMSAPQSTDSRTKLAGLIADIDDVKSLADVPRAAALQRRLASGTFFRIAIGIDPGDSTRYAVLLHHGGYELPTAAMYSDPSQAELIDRYHDHITELSRLVLGAPIDADAALRVETALAAASTPDDQRLDPASLYHPMSLEELSALTPSFDWSTYFAELGYGQPELIDVIDLAFIEKLETILTTTPIADLAAYMSWQLVQDHSPECDQPVLDEDFAFASLFTGQVTPDDRGTTCFNATLGYLGMAVAQPYIAGWWNADARAVAQTSSAAIVGAFGKRLAAAAWLDGGTRQTAQLKLGKASFLIGHPTSWPSYADVTSGSLYFDNVTQVDTQGMDRSQEILSGPVDRNAWQISPLLVNAIYSPSLNQITLTAMILAPPFVVEKAAAARNAGSISTIIGHELTHGFDDEGRHFDENGNLRDWWSAASAAGFETRTQCLVDQFDGYEVLPGQFVNGRQSLGENIADLGGVVTAYHSLFSDGGPGSSGGDGFSAEQIFFLAYAQNYCEIIRPELQQQRLLTDEHSPAKYRVNGPLSNLPEFANAFHCKAGAPMVRANGCQVW
jgi:predicted metalloendopeptidase